MASKRMSTWSGALLGTVLAFACSTYGAAQQLTEEFHHTYPIAANGAVDVSNVNGRVQISGTESNEVKVDAIKRADSQQALNEARIEVDTTANSLRVHTEYPDDRDRSNRSRAASVEYT